MVRDEIGPLRLFTGIDEFQREVVDKLNAVTKELGLPDYFSHNGNHKMQHKGKPMTYLSLQCTGCQHLYTVWFKWT
jgi:hypothetical protein